MPLPLFSLLFAFAVLCRQFAFYHAPPAPLYHTVAVYAGLRTRCLCRVCTPGDVCANATYRRYVYVYRLPNACRHVSGTPFLEHADLFGFVRMHSLWRCRLLHLNVAAVHLPTTVLVSPLRLVATRLLFFSSTRCLRSRLPHATPDFPDAHTGRLPHTVPYVRSLCYAICVAQDCTGWNGAHSCPALQCTRCSSELRFAVSNVLLPRAFSLDVRDGLPRHTASFHGLHLFLVSPFALV